MENRHDISFPHSRYDALPGAHGHFILSHERQLNAHDQDMTSQPYSRLTTAGRMNPNTSACAHTQLQRTHSQHTHTVIPFSSSCMPTNRISTRRPQTVNPTDNLNRHQPEHSHPSSSLLRPKASTFAHPSRTNPYSNSQQDPVIYPAVL